MQKMENWAHRLYPKMQFEEFIDKIESLGSKKEVQVSKTSGFTMRMKRKEFYMEEKSSSSRNRSHRMCSYFPSVLFFLFYFYYLALSL